MDNLGQFYLLSLAPIVMLLAGCANDALLCEDILEVKQQHQRCEQLTRVMKNDRNPQQALTARKQFETECEDLRYYRDDYDTICKNGETPISKELREQKRD